MIDMIAENQLTLDEYLVMCRNTTDQLEVINGRWIINGGLGADMAGGTGWKHQRYGKNILDSLTPFVKKNRLGLVMTHHTHL